MAKLLIIADDLTGALDSAAQFVKKQISVAVATDIDNLKNIQGKHEVLAVNTESRHMSAQKAAEAVRAAAEYGASMGIQYCYKKIDSTLRGNIGAELEALFDICANSELMLVPSYCKLGRTVLDGCLYVHGIPVSETAFGKDPLAPVKKDNIADVIREQTDIPAYSIKNFFELPPASKDKKVYIFDAETEKDLYKIGDLLMRQGRIGMTAGSGGFAGFLSDMPVFEKRLDEKVKVKPPILTVCGSLNEVSRRQISYAAGLGHRIIGVDFESAENASSLNREIEQAVDFLKKGVNVIVKTLPPQNLDRAVARRKIKTEALKISKILGDFARDIIEGSGISTLMVFGGDTAAGTLNSLGISWVEPLKEISPGVVLSKTVNLRHSLLLITKAGGFGDEDLIEKITEMMEG
ncbi:MAG: hypothetical protein FWH48_10810 [Oscillospiraceae bacterium]|nr:hypothetical protein [Oscillospiraceae bacterium]